MIKIPILRGGKPYTSLDEFALTDHRSGEVLAHVSQANSGLIVKDLAAADKAWKELRSLSLTEIVKIFRKAGELFLTGKFAIAEIDEGPQEFVQRQAATTGMPEALCRRNMEKIHYAFTHIEDILCGLSGLDLAILDRGYGRHMGNVVSYSCLARSFGAVLPNNSPGVHSLWLPVPALRVPVLIKPGAQDPWTPLRISQALIEAGYPPQALGFYPTDHGGSSTLLINCDRGMVFGDISSVGMWYKDPRIEIHGPGHSKVLLGEDIVENWEDYLDIITSSIAANGGRSCVNASSVWTPKYSREIADALARRFAQIVPRKMDDPEAQLAAFSNPRVAEYIDGAIESGLRDSGGEDITAKYRTGPRLMELQASVFLQPTLVWCESLQHPLANREFLFPYASVIEMSNKEMLSQIERTLVVTAITKDTSWEHSLVHCAQIERLNIGELATWQVDWHQPHEGNLFRLLYQQRAFQRAGGIA